MWIASVSFIAEKLTFFWAPVTSWHILQSGPPDAPLPLPSAPSWNVKVDVTVYPPWQALHWLLEIYWVWSVPPPDAFLLLMFTGVCSRMPHIIILLLLRWQKTQSVELIPGAIILFFVLFAP
jgi:hypothetical protein